MDWLLRPIERSLRSAIMDMLENILGNFNESVAGAGEVVRQTPMEFDANVFNMLRSLSDNAIMPIAGLVLTVLMTYELIGMLMAKNNMSDIEPAMFVKWGIKLVLGIVFLTNAFTIVNGIFNIGAIAITAASGGGSGGIGADGNWLLNFMPWLVGAIGVLITFFGVAALGIGFSSDSAAEKQKGIIGIVGGIIVIGAGALIRTVGNMLTGGAAGGMTDNTVNMQFGGPTVMANVQAGLENMGIGSLLSMFLTLFLIQIILLIVGALVTVIVIHRFIEIYMYVSLSALPMSTFVNSEMSSIGKNYVKTIAAYSFQGLLIIVVLNIFGTLVESQITANIAAAVGDGSDASGLGGSMFLLAGFCVLLAFAIIKTGSVAKAIFGVS